MVPTTSLIHNFWLLATVDSIFVGEKSLDVKNAFENNPKIIAAVKFIHAAVQLFGNNFALYL